MRVVRSARHWSSQLVGVSGRWRASSRRSAGIFNSPVRICCWTMGRTARIWFFFFFFLWGFVFYPNFLLGFHAATRRQTPTPCPVSNLVVSLSNKTLKVNGKWPTVLAAFYLNKLFLSFFFYFFPGCPAHLTRPIERALFVPVPRIAATHLQVLPLASQLMSSAYCPPID